jgi:HAMP domain-containing protein
MDTDRRNARNEVLEEAAREVEAYDVEVEAPHPSTRRTAEAAIKATKIALAKRIRALKQ